MYAMNRVKFLNLHQLKIIEELYSVSSLYQPKEFGEALLIFVKIKGPQTLRKALDKWEHRVNYFVEKDHDYSHEEMCNIKEELKNLDEIKSLFVY
jgi:hypothetical protein